MSYYSVVEHTDCELVHAANIYSYGGNGSIKGDGETRVLVTLHEDACHRQFWLATLWNI